MNIETGTVYDQSLIDAGKILWDEITAAIANATGTNAPVLKITLTSDENTKLWAYNDFLHRTLHPGITPQAAFGVPVIVFDPPPPPPPPPPSPPPPP